MEKNRPARAEGEVTGGARSRRLSLRPRLLVAFSGLALVPLLASNSIGYLRSRDILEGLVQRYLVAMVQLQAEHIDDRLRLRAVHLDEMASGTDLFRSALDRPSERASEGDVDADEVGQYLASKLEASERFAALALLDTSGRVYASAGSDLPRAVPETPEPFELIATGSETPPILRYASSIPSRHGTVLGFLVATVPLGRAGEYLEIPEHAAGAVESFILDPNGLPLFVSHPHGHLPYDRRFASPLTAADVGETARYLDREGVAVLGASAAVSSYGWRYLVEVPIEDALVELRSLRALSIVLAGAMLALVVAAAWLVSYQIVAPVSTLVDAVRRFAAGELEVRVEASGDDEISELGLAFNEMAVELSDNQRRIEQLHRSEIERAEQLATVGQLASGVAHEIKNPVVSISNGLDLVLRSLSEREELVPITTEMKRQLDRIEHAIEDLLAFGRPRDPEFEWTTVEDVLARAALLLEPRAKQSGVSLEVSRGVEENRIHADPELLLQAIVNLAMNAIQFSGPGDRVRIEASESAGTVSIAVHDQGPGVDPEAEPFLFRPFFTTRHMGTGLGLSITQGIARQHFGHVEVNSTPGVGSTFTLVLPRDAERPREAGR
jgi:signal transduction histidine kinase